MKNYYVYWLNIIIFISSSISAYAQSTNIDLESSITLKDLVIQGGWAMWPLGLFSFVLLYFIIRNVILLREKEMLRPDLFNKIEECLSDNNIKSAREICSKNESLITSVLDAGLKRLDEENINDLSQVMEAIEEAGNEQMVIYMKPINYLSIIGSTAPMLGLLGTVSGMIKAFSIISQGGMGDPGKLAGSIGEALVTTATGLVIAIPAMIAYFIFKNNFIKTMSTMGIKVSDLINIYRKSIIKENTN